MKRLSIGLAFCSVLLIFSAGCSPKEEKPSTIEGPPPKVDSPGTAEALPGSKIPPDPRKKK
jgi:hypothetical protein